MAMKVWFLGTCLSAPPAGAAAWAGAWLGAAAAAGAVVAAGLAAGAAVGAAAGGWVGAAAAGAVVAAGAAGGSLGAHAARTPSPAVRPNPTSSWRRVNRCLEKSDDSCMPRLLHTGALLRALPR